MTQEVSDLQETAGKGLFDAPKPSGATGAEAKGETPAETFDKEYVQKLRDEAAKYRTQLREVQGQLKDLQPLAEQAKHAEEAQKSDLQKALDKLAKLEGEAKAAQAKADALARANKLLSLAAKANVDASILDYLDVSKFDLDDEEKTLEALKRFGKATQTTATGGKPSNPARGEGEGKATEAEMRSFHFGAGRSNRDLIFPRQNVTIGG